MKPQNADLPKEELDHSDIKVKMKRNKQVSFMSEEPDTGGGSTGLLRSIKSMANPSRNNESL